MAASALARPISGHLMIRSLSVKNFRCFDHFKSDRCARVNVIVGDNGTGKTSLLEALFFALGNSSEYSARFRQQRGLEASFSGNIKGIEEGLWRDLFHNDDWAQSIAIELEGDGPENRSVTISRGAGQLSMPLILGDDIFVTTTGNVSPPSRTDGDGEAISGSLSIVWRDQHGNERAAYPKVTKGGIEFPTTGEDNPDFFYFSATHVPRSSENATRFSALSRAREADRFVKIVIDQFPWIEDLNIEALAGSPVIYATLKGEPNKRPLPNVSGGINRIVGVMLAITARRNGVVLVDELEDGLFHTHYKAFWRAIIALCREYHTQLFVTTHSKEWLEALVSTQDELKDVSLWRLERGEPGRQPDLFQFEGRDIIAGVEFGAELRGGVE